MDKRSVTIKDISVKRKIVEEIFRQKSAPIGCFHKPKVPGIIIPNWTVASVSNPVFLKFIGKEMSKIIREIGGADILCGIETAGIGIVAAVSMVSGIPWIYARKERKTYGSMEAFEGTYHRGAKVIFIDNFTAKGKGMPEILKNAEEEGFIFHHQISIIDGEWQKVDEYEKYDITVHSLITQTEVIEGLGKLNYFPGKLYDLTMSYTKNPAEWTQDSKIVKDFIEELNKAPNLDYINKKSCENI